MSNKITPSNVHYENIRISTTAAWAVNRWGREYLYLLSPQTTSLQFGDYGSIVLLPNRLTFIPYPDNQKVTAPLNINTIYFTSIASDELLPVGDITTSTMYQAERAQQGWTVTDAIFTGGSNLTVGMQIFGLGFNNAQNVAPTNLIVTRIYVAILGTGSLSNTFIRLSNGPADTHLTNQIFPVNHKADAPTGFPSYAKITDGTTTIANGSGNIVFEGVSSGDQMNGTQTYQIGKSNPGYIAVYANAAAINTTILINMEYFEEY